MGFLLDQDVYASTSHVLRELGHDVACAAEIGLSWASDQDLLEIAQQQERILVTRDRDFGSLVFLNEIGAGVIYLRMLPAAQVAVHRVLRRVLDTYSEAELKKGFVVVEADRYRFRRLPGR
jgi:predicted nuclease of predicted toxin-antitoxin system